LMGPHKSPWTRSSSPVAHCLAYDAIHAELMDVFNMGKALHRPALLQLGKDVEVKMFVALMPQSRIIGYACGQAEGVPNLHP
jgi:hypothetical protein